MNARVEFLKVIERWGAVKCAHITTEDYVNAVLCVDHTEEEFAKFLELLDFVYNSGFGGQNLYGTIWLKDNNWVDRGEYDGSEWWQLHSLPPIPSNLLK